MNTVDVLTTAINAYGEKINEDKCMSITGHFVDYRRSLDVLRNELKLCLHYKVISFRFIQAADKFLETIDKEHEYCNRKIGESTE